MAEVFQLLREARLLTAISVIGVSAVMLAIAGGNRTTIPISPKMRYVCVGFGLAFMSTGLGGYALSLQTGDGTPVPTPTVAAPTVTDSLAPTSVLTTVAIYTADPATSTSSPAQDSPLPTGSENKPGQDDHDDNAAAVHLGRAIVPSALQCDPQLYSGIQHCTQGAVQILKIDPRAPHVRFETVLSQGYDRDGNFGECRDVNIPENSTGPGCEFDGKYPAELIGDMVGRHPGAVAAFNADFFGRIHGPGGLTLKNGVRLDGVYGDHDENEVTRSSLSISSDGDVRIGIVDRTSLPNPSEPWTWMPDPVAYHNSVGGIPLLVHEGAPTNIKKQCMVETPPLGGNIDCSMRHHVFRHLHRRFMKHDASSRKGYECSSRKTNWYNCPSPSTRRARTAVGKTEDGQLIVTVVSESAGLTLYQLADILIGLGAVEAINLDGGRSSQLWYDGDYLVSPARPVANGVLIFSQVAQPPAGSWQKRHRLSHGRSL